MKKLLTTFILVLFNIILFGQNQCEDPLKAEFNKLEVSDEKSYILKLHQLYNSEVDYNKYRQNTGAANALGSWGSASYSQNKTNLESLYSKVTNSINVDLNDQEKIHLLQISASDESIQMRMNAYIQCKAITSFHPYLQIQAAGKNEVAVVLDMVPSRDANKRESKVIGMNMSSNLTTIPGNIKTDDILTYGNSYTLIFSRSNEDEAWVSINLNGLSPLVITIPSTKKPVMGIMWVDKELVLDYEQDISGNKIMITAPPTAIQTFTFSNQPVGDDYKLSWQMKTGLPSGSIEVINALLVPVAPNYHREFSWNGTYIVKGSEILIPWNIRTKSKRLKGKIYIKYKEKIEACVANCP